MHVAGCGEGQGHVGRDGELTIAALEAGPTLEEPEQELLSLRDSTNSPREFGGTRLPLPLSLNSRESLKCNTWMH